MSCDHDVCASRITLCAKANHHWQEYVVVRSSHLTATADDSDYTMKVSLNFHVNCLVSTPRELPVDDYNPLLVFCS